MAEELLTVNINHCRCNPICSLRFWLLYAQPTLFVGLRVELIPKSDLVCSRRPPHVRVPTNKLGTPPCTVSMYHSGRKCKERLVFIFILQRSLHFRPQRSCSYGKGRTRQLHSTPIAVSGSGHTKTLINSLNAAVPYAKKSGPKAVLSRMQLTLHATRPTPHGASRLVQAMPAWWVKTRRAPSRHCRGARAYDLTSTDHALQ